MEGAEGGQGLGEAVGREVWGLRGSRGPELTWLRSFSPWLPAEDGHSCGALQTGQRPHQGERAASGDDRAAHAAIQGAGTKDGRLV